MFIKVDLDDYFPIYEQIVLEVKKGIVKDEIHKPIFSLICKLGLALFVALFIWVHIVNI